MSLIPNRPRWAELIEAIHTPAVDDATWSAPIVEALHRVLPGAEVTGVYVVEHSADCSRVDIRYSTPLDGYESLVQDVNKIVADSGGRTFSAFHFGAPVLTYLEGFHASIKDDRERLRDWRSRTPSADGVGIVAHPAPGVVAVAHALYRNPVELSRHERILLTRVALHLETGYRARKDPEVLRAEIDAKGRIHARDDLSLPESVISLRAARTDEARSRTYRSSLEGAEMWTALVGGEVSLAPRPGGGYLVLHNPPVRRAVRALTPTETAVLAQAARGVSNKMTAYALGVSPAAVSERLASAAAKLGAASRADLLRVAAVLVGDPRAELPTEKLTSAEHEVLELLQRGLSNAQIARLRGRSVRTIANQVAALLRKTESGSRRALVTKPRGQPSY